MNEIVPMRLLDPGSEHYLVDDVGIVSALDIVPSNTAHVHATFWDLRSRGREALCRQMIRYICERHSLAYVSTYLMPDNRTGREFVKRIGFRLANDSGAMAHYTLDYFSCCTVQPLAGVYTDG